MAVSSVPGKVYLVGAGPGDPGLLTLRAAQLLGTADVLYYDALVADAIVAMAPPSCQRIYVGKRAGAHAVAQDEIERRMIGSARSGKSVVRLKGGDPYVFGRGGEEAQALREAGIAFEVVPGVSSVFAVPAYAGIPITHREHAAAFTVLTGHEDPTKSTSTLDWQKLADPQRTLVLLMATATLREIAQQLMAHGLSPDVPVAVIRDGTRPSQRTLVGTLNTIADDVARAKLTPPAIVVVGTVVRLRKTLRWYEDGPLFGKRVLITRAGPQAEGFAAALLARGAQPILAPTIAIEAADDLTDIDDPLADLAAYAWIVFTSQNGVDAFFAAIARRGGDTRVIQTAKVAAIGERTAERLRAFGVNADVVASEFISESLAHAVIARSQPNDRVLLYRAADARDVLPRMLEAAGRHPTVIAAYKTVVPNDDEFAQKAAGADVLTFTSASTVRGFAALLGGDAAAAIAAGSKCVACIGPITAAAATATLLHVDVVATAYTTDGLLASLESYFAQP